MNKTLQAALVIGAVDLISRGLDYVLGSPANGTNLEFSENLTLTWGVACLVSAFIICVGVLFKNFKIAILGSLSAFAVYTVLGFTILDDTIFMHPPDDWRLISSHWCKGAMFALFATSLAFRHGVINILERRKEIRGEL